MLTLILVLIVGLVAGAHWNVQVNMAVAKVVDLVKGAVAKIKG